MTSRLSIETTPRPDRASPLPGLLLRLIVLFGAVTFLVGSFLHTGIAIPLGVFTLDEPVIVPATIVEGLAGLLLTASAWFIFTHHRRAWRMTLVALGLSLGGVLLGIGALRAGRGPRTELNDDYHIVMVVLLVLGLALMATSAVREDLSRGSEKDDAR
jgi:hypothetical protein